MQVFDSMRKTIENMVNIPEGEWNYFTSLVVAKDLKKGAYLLHEGQNSEELYFVKTGLFRMFYLGLDGSEIVRGFVFENGIMAAYSSLLLNLPSWMSLQALETSEVLAIKFSDFVSLYERHVCWQILGRKIAERLFILKETREFEFLTMSASERYQSFARKYPHLISRIPKNQLASYLGITAVALSRILSNLK